MKQNFIQWERLSVLFVSTIFENILKQVFSCFFACLKKISLDLLKEGVGENEVTEIGIEKCVKHDSKTEPFLLHSSELGFWMDLNTLFRFCESSLTLDNQYLQRLSWWTSSEDFTTKISMRLLWSVWHKKSK